MSEFNPNYYVPNVAYIASTLNNEAFAFSANTPTGGNAWAKLPLPNDTVTGLPKKILATDYKGIGVNVALHATRGSSSDFLAAFSSITNSWSVLPTAVDNSDNILVIGNVAYVAQFNQNLLHAFSAVTGQWS